MTPQELKFEIAMLESKKRRASFPQMVAVGAFVAGAIIICLSIEIWFPDGTAPEWLLLLLAPAALAMWLGTGKLMEHLSPGSDWTHQDDVRLQELKRQRSYLGLQQ